VGGLQTESTSAIAVKAAFQNDKRRFTMPHETNFGKLLDQSRRSPGADVASCSSEFSNSRRRYAQFQRPGAQSLRCSSWNRRKSASSSLTTKAAGARTQTEPADPCAPGLAASVSRLRALKPSPATSASAPGLRGLQVHTHQRRRTRGGVPYRLGAAAAYSPRAGR
jgi:hypothetical protein